MREVEVTGRRDELATLRQELLGPARLVTLTGPGGTGKTWLARAVTGEVRRALRGETHVLEVGDLGDERLLVETVARRLGLPHDPGAGLPELVALVGDRHALLVLDGCERLLPWAATLVAGLLRGCPGLRVLTTSRRPLGLTGEQVVLVPPLSVPADPSVDPLTAATHDAVALFVERATTVLPGFRLTEENVGAVVQICARLDGNPLAIELAAAKAGLLAPDAVLRRLDDRFRLLTDRRSEASGQVRSLRACVETSWELCTERERTLWARLSVFPADFELDAVEAVCSGDGIEQDEVLDLVDSLLAQSVLLREADPVAVRYRLPESLRVHGADVLGPHQHRRWSERRARWVEELASQARRDWSGPRQASTVRRLEREHPTLVASLAEAVADPDRAPWALRTVTALEPWWPATTRVSEGRDWLVAALHHGTGTPEERVQAAAVAAWWAALQSDLVEADRLLAGASSVTGAPAPGTLRLLARARGGVALARQDGAAAEEAFRVTLELAEQKGDGAAAAEAWLLLAATSRLDGRLDDAQQALHRCSTLADRVGDAQLRASAVALQSLDALDRGDAATAVRLARAALAPKAAVDDCATVSLVLEVLAWAALAQGEPVRAAVILGAADRMRQRAGRAPAALSPLAAGREERFEALRVALGRRELQRHTARGAALSRDDAVRYVGGDTVPQQRQPGTPPLTTRELAVAELVARGMTNREIAASLVISVRTVQGHLEHILRKLDFGSRAQVAAWVAHREVDPMAP